MTRTFEDHAAAHHAARTPTYDGPGAVEILRRLRGLGGFTEHAANAIESKDVERAYAAACRAEAEATSIREALELARPAEILDELAVEKRRIAPEWQPDPARGGDPLVDTAQADPVLVSANDLIDLLRTCCCGMPNDMPMPDGAGRAAVHIARQQPHRLVDFFIVGGARARQVRAAVVRAGVLPDHLQDS